MSTCIVLLVALQVGSAAGLKDAAKVQATTRIGTVVDRRSSTAVDVAKRTKRGVSKKKFGEIHVYR